MYATEDNYNHSQGNAVYAYDSKTELYTMGWASETYQFKYNESKHTVATAYKNGKLIAKSYKGFRNKLGIASGSGIASAFHRCISKGVEGKKKQYA